LIEKRGFLFDFPVNNRFIWRSSDLMANLKIASLLISFFSALVVGIFVGK